MGMPVVMDHAPWGVKFGENILAPGRVYAAGHKVMVEFQSGNPRNDLMTDGTYLSVEREEDQRVVRLVQSHYRVGHPQGGNARQLQDLSFWAQEIDRGPPGGLQRVHEIFLGDDAFRHNHRRLK